MGSSVSSSPTTRDLAHDPDAGNSSTVVPPPAYTESRVSDGSTFSLPTDPLANILANSPKELVPRTPLLSTNSSDVSPDLFTPPAPVFDGGGVFLVVQVALKLTPLAVRSPYAWLQP